MKKFDHIMYIGPKIDRQAMESRAFKYYERGESTRIHYHTKEENCEGKRHTSYNVKDKDNER